MKLIIRSIFCACLLLTSTMLFADAPTVDTNTSVNINTADAETLAKTLKGIGGSKAQAIVEYRKLNGKFKSVEELTEIKGIGIKLIEDNRTRINL